MLARGLCQSVSSCARAFLRGGSVLHMKHAQPSLMKCSFHSSAAFFKTYFAKSHEWVTVNSDGTGTIGITKYAQDQLGDVVFVDLPDVDAEVEAGGNISIVESVKAASDIYSPVSGKIKEVNEKLDDKPDLINKDPMGEGWIAKVILSDPEQLKNLMNEEQYKKTLDEE